MEKPVIEVREVAQSTPEQEVCFDIRRRVFVEEQRVDPRDEYDVYETSARHYLARLDGRAAGTARARITPEGAYKLERIAVLPWARNRGIGSALVRQMLADAPAGCLIYMHAQTHALPFYTSLGFAGVDDRFQEAGIDHQKMIYAPERAAEA